MTLEQMHRVAPEVREDIFRLCFADPWRKSTALGKLTVVPLFAIWGVMGFAFALPIMAGLWLYLDSGIERWIWKEEAR